LIGADGVKLYGGSGDGVLISATGAWLWGSAGNDVYRFDIGAGLATVNQYDAEYRDVIEFGEGIAAADVALRKDGDDLLVLVDEEGFRMKSWFDSWRYQASAFRFADGGEIITEEYLANKPVVVEASVSGERLHGHGGKDVMIACEGVYLYGKEGDDALIAAENAHLHGGAGADEYIFQDRFHGATVYADSATDGPADIARFEDVSAESLWFRRSGDNLLVDSLEDGQRVTFANWFDGARYRPGEIHAGNEVAMAEQVNRLVTAMAEFAPPSMGAGGAMPEDVRTALAPDLAASWSVAA
jgi:Ca2+-binding RTX toxin-like protein